MEASPRHLEGPPSRLSWVPAAQHQQCSPVHCCQDGDPPLPFQLNYEPFMPTSAHPLRSVRSQPHTIP